MAVGRRGARPLAAAAAALALLAGCGGTPTGPSGNPPRVTAINPSSGPTSGGTSVTISGSNFAAGAIVTIGGTPATNVTVVSASTLTATTSPRSAGAADVVVNVGGRSGTLSNAFTYVAGQPPVILSITARGSRPNQPERFADLGEEITVTATVQDSDTPAANLTFGWGSAGGGTITGNGSSIRWRAPQSFTTPGTITISLSVSDGGATAQGNVVVRVHDSVKEVGDMAKLFLEDFSRQSLPPEQVVRNFGEGCGLGGQGKENELLDVQNNQRTHDITQWTVGSPTVTINFGGVCPFRARLGDACAALPVTWTSTCIMETRLDGTKVCTLGQVERVTGIDQVTAAYAAATRVDVQTVEIRIRFAAVLQCANAHPGHAPFALRHPPPCWRRSG
jgi:hypothetical protein